MGGLPSIVYYTVDISVTVLEPSNETRETKDIYNLIL
jgi:hypothetical protein